MIACSMTYIILFHLLMCSLYAAQSDSLDNTTTITDQKRHISGISEIIDRYDTFFLDLYGVLWINPSGPIKGANECLIRLKETGKKTVLITNSDQTSENLSHDLIEKYHFHHLHAVIDNIVTAGDMLLDSLKEWGLDNSSTRAFLWGRPTDIMASFQSVSSYEDANVVVCNCKPTLLQIEKLPAELEPHREMLDFMLTKNIPLLVPDNDVITPTSVGVAYLSSGWYAQQFEKMGGTVLTSSKPKVDIFERAYELAARPNKVRIVMIGDTMETDIHGACNFGIHSVLIQDEDHQNTHPHLGDPLPKHVRPTWITRRLCL